MSHCVTWLPYNGISLVAIAWPGLSGLAEHADWLKALIILNALLNPFLYGISTDR